MQSKNKIYISIGSNIDPHIHVPHACAELSELLEDAVISPIYQSPAVGMIGNDFVNAVIGGITDKSVDDLVGIFRSLERSAGRVRNENKFSDRTLDVDLLLYGNLCSAPKADDARKVTLPHPEITDQAYVLQPLADIAAEVVHPATGVEFLELLRNLKLESPEKFLSLKKITLPSVCK